MVEELDNEIADLETQESDSKLDKRIPASRQSLCDSVRFSLKIIGAVLILAVVIAAINDWRYIMHIFKVLIDWVKDEPFKAGIAIVVVYIFLIVFSMPIVFFSVPLGFAFH